MLRDATSTAGLDFDFPNLDRAMVDAIVSTFSDFAEAPGQDSAFLALLDRILGLTTSQFGFIAEVQSAHGGSSCVKMRALRAARDAKQGGLFSRV